MDRYRKKGPAQSTRLLIETLLESGVEGMTLLDIGGGVGAIQHALLNGGASRATDVDAASAYLEAARAQAERLGLEERVTYRKGNFVDLAGEISAADIVTLDRVICCYDDMPALVSLSAGRARRLYGLVYPRDTWAARALNPVANLLLRIARTPFRVFVHRTRDVDALVHAQGLERCYHKNMGVWQVVVYKRE